MKRNYVLTYSCLLLFILFGCDSNDNPNETCKSLNGKIKIMPLGASRVQGFRPVFESYRYELWKELIDGGWSTDFVGSQMDISLHNSYKNYCFDKDHQGHSGWTSLQIKNAIETWLNQSEKPDIVLFSSPGGNDALQGESLESIVPNINTIIDKIQAHNPNVTILIEQMAPGKSSFMDDELTASFEQIHTIIAEIADAQTTVDSKVIPVDMASGLSDEFLADNIHYNMKGAKFVAGRYYDKLVPYLEK